MENDNLNINGYNFGFSSKLTLSNLGIISGNNKDLGLSNYRCRVATVIFNSIIPKDNKENTNIDSICLSDDSLFQIYIEAVIRDNGYLSPYFLKYNDEELCMRFCKTCEDYYNTLMQEMAVKISKAFQENASHLTELSKTISLCANGIGNIVCKLATTISPVTNYINSIQETISKSLKLFSEHLNQIDWQSWENNYKQWGMYGWAIIGNAPFDLYSEAPQSQKEADTEALKYFKKSLLLDFWSNIKKHHLSKQEMIDLNEAISCFNSRNYKSCSLVVCAIIEGICIKSQDTNENLKVGSKAVEKFEKKYQIGNAELTSRFFLFYYINLIQCLNTLFESAYGFINEPPRFNRNFVSHGMSSRKVLKKDCIKLFLILNNLMEFNEWAFDESNEN